MEPRESIVFYSSFFEAIDSLPEENQAECYRAVMRYGLYGEEPEPGTLGYTMFLAFRKQIDVNQKRFENSKKKPKRDQTTTKPQPNRNQTTTKPPANVNVNVNVNENVNENENVNVSSNEDITPLSSNEDNSSAKPTREHVPYQEVVEKFNEICLSLPQVQKLTPARRQAIKGRCSEYSVPEIVDVFRRAENSDFLSGRNGNWSGCSFDWLMKPANFLKVLEGNYENQPAINQPSKINGHDELNEFYAMTARWAEGDNSG